MRRFETILFDVDETLLDFSLAEKNALKKTLEDVEVKLTDEMVAAYKKINKRFWIMLEKGEITKEKLKAQRWQKFLDEYDLVFDAEMMGAKYLDHVGEGAFLIDGAREICEELYKEYTLAIVTNGIGKTQNRRLEKANFKKYFKEIFVSEEMGLHKPDIEYFNVVFETLRIADKSKVLIVGDSLTSDMRGGNNAGIATCWYNPNGLTNDTDVVCDFEIAHLNDIKDILK